MADEAGRSKDVDAYIATQPPATRRALEELRSCIWQAEAGVSDDLLKGGPVPFVVVVLTMLGIASVVALFSTGALLSVGSLPHAPLLVVHRVALVTLPLSAVPVGATLLAGFHA